LLERVCADPSPVLSDCKHSFAELKQAAYIDVDYDAISHAVVFTAFWPSLGEFELSRRASRPIRKSRAEDRIEVGILHPEVAKEPEQLSLGGFLTVIGDDDHPGIPYVPTPAKRLLTIVQVLPCSLFQLDTIPYPNRPQPHIERNSKRQVVFTRS
jgi:hypothetical protein